MRPNLAIITILALLCLSTSTATAAPDPVYACREECRPREANDGMVRERDDSVDVILYAHIENILDDAPLNTQMPGPEEDRGDDGVGFLLPTIDTETGLCVAGTCADVHFPNNKISMFTSPGLVEVMPDGTWRTFQANELGDRLRLTGENLRMYWYMSADAVKQDDTPLGAVADLQVSARLMSNFHREPDGILAESVPDAAVAVTPLVALPNGRTVYEFRIDMPVDLEAVSWMRPEAGLTLTVEWHEVDLGRMGEVVQSDWRIHFGPRYLPRLILPMAEPIAVVSSSLTHYEGELYLRWSLNPVFGSYDLADPSLRMTVVESPSGLLPHVKHVSLRRSIDCHGSVKPVNATWSIDYRQQTLPDGHYVVRASIMNRQETYRAVQDFEFNVTGGIPEGAPVFTGVAKVPGLGAPLFALVLFGVACVQARRRCA